MQMRENKYVIETTAATIEWGVVKNERMTSVNWNQDVRHIEILLQNKNIIYEAGDIAVIYPENVFDVDQFLKQYIPGTTEEADTLDGDTIVFASSKRDPNKWLFPPQHCAMYF